MLGVYYIDHKTQANSFSPYSVEVWRMHVYDAALCSEAFVLHVMLAVDDVWDCVIVRDHVKGVSLRTKCAATLWVDNYGLVFVCKVNAFSF
jgi:hypothetical protein